MSNETSKNRARRERNGDFEKFFRGRGLDVGGGNDPVTPDCIVYDRKPTLNGRYVVGDAQWISEFGAESFDWIHSSHCLEHLSAPAQALSSWWRLIKPGGHLILVVPDYFLYEKKHFPSLFNEEHKNVFEFRTVLQVFEHLPNCQILRVQINDEGFDYSDKTSDQTRSGAQAELEVIARKHSDSFWANV